MNRKFDLSDMRCVVCNSVNLTRRPAFAEARTEIVRDAVKCQDCGALSSAIWGIPYFGGFERGDVPGLIEIAAKAAFSEDINRNSFEQLDEILSDYHRSEARAKFVETCPNDMVRKPWFQHRYRDWRAFAELTNGIPLDGLRILDVAAGTGFDSYRLVKAGAHVTALDFNPFLVRQGADELPEIRWVGGFAHVLPFVNDCFDVVCCNAGLHHMRNIPASISEMLRVVKPQGLLLTTCDPYRRDNSTEDVELKVFDQNPMVLGGINEGIPPLGDILNPLADLKEASVDILTARVTSPQQPEARPEFTHNLDLSGFNWWTRDRHQEFLRTTSGNVSIRVLGISTRSGNPPLQRSAVLNPADLAAKLHCESEAVACLANLVSSEFVNQPFPFRKHSKFNLLNGWRTFREGAPAMPAYRRARWFLTRSADDAQLDFEVNLDDQSLSEKAAVVVFLNATPMARIDWRKAGWRTIRVPLSAVPVGANYCCEIQVWPDGEPARDSFSFTLSDRFRFQVRNRVVKSAA